MVMKFNEGNALMISVQTFVLFENPKVQRSQSPQRYHVGEKYVYF